MNWAEEPEDKNDQLRVSGLEVLETMKPIMETLEGFKAMCAELGYSEHNQEEMAVAMFKHIMSGQNADNQQQ